METFFIHLVICNTQWKAGLSKNQRQFDCSMQENIYAFKWVKICENVYQLDMFAKNIHKMACESN